MLHCDSAHDRIELCNLVFEVYCHNLLGLVARKAFLHNQLHERFLSIYDAFRYLPSALHFVRSVTVCEYLTDESVSVQANWITK